MDVAGVVLGMAGISVQERKTEGETLPGLDRLIGSARHRIKIVSGGLPRRVYGEVPVFPALQQARQRGCKIQIVVGPKADQESMAKLTGIGAEVYKLDRWPERHFAVIDGRHARLEEPHAEIAEKRVQYIVRNYKYAQRLETMFDIMIQKAQRYGDAGS